MKLWKQIVLTLVLVIVMAYIRTQERQSEIRPAQLPDEDAAQREERMFHRKLIDDQLDERLGRQ